ncbi:MAG: Type 1 glutamine amidotransferase-like domain-containing protein, partial [Pseudomonadota bacterium]
EIIFIDGGSTRNLLALLREWSAIDALVAAYERGVLIAGASAGISMLFERCISDSVRTKIRPVSGIGLLKGTVCAHYNAREERRDVLRSLVNGKRQFLPAYGLDDGVAALFVNGRLSRSYTVTEGARLHEFVVRGDSVEHLVQTP